VLQIPCKEVIPIDFGLIYKPEGYNYGLYVPIAKKIAKVCCPGYLTRILVSFILPAQKTP
jgi:hypothetical protein